MLCIVNFYVVEANLGWIVVNLVKNNFYLQHINITPLHSSYHVKPITSISMINPTFTPSGELKISLIFVSFIFITVIIVVRSRFNVGASKHDLTTIMTEMKIKQMTINEIFNV